MRSIFPAAVILCAAACGDDGSSNPDAPTTIDAPMTIDAPPLPGGCDYAELLDATNDDVAGSGAPETTGKTLGATSLTLCGQVDVTHFDAGLVDIDGYAVNLPAGRIRVTVSGTGLEALDEVILGAYSGTNFGNIEEETTLRGTHVFYMDSFSTAGAFEFAVIATNPTAPTAAIPYKIVITVDDPSARCPKITAAANHTEGTDTGNTSNDVVDINYGLGADYESLSPVTTDVPEVATGGTIGATTNYRISGTLANTVAVGSYKDRDTFSIMTGPTTDELSVRINWPGAADLDMFLYDVTTTTVVPLKNVGTSQILANTEDEYKTFAVKPNSTYWLWTGLDQSSTGPIAYSLSLCGADFTPP
jgi:hypothetical protein